MGFRRWPWLLAWFAGVATTLVVLVPSVEAQPHLVSNIQLLPEEIPPGDVIAEIYALYEVDTEDWEAMKERVADQLAVALNVSSRYVELFNIEAFFLDERCVPASIKCYDGPPDNRRLISAPGLGGMGIDGSLMETDVRDCIPGPSVTDQVYGTPLSEQEWIPDWDKEDDDDLELLAWLTDLCVSATNTSLQYYPLVFNNTYVTGQRDPYNTRVFADDAGGNPWLLYIVGSIRTDTARFFNVKFIMERDIPLPEYQPEVSDVVAEWTDELNMSIKIYGMRQGMGFDDDIFMEHIPVCEIPPSPKKGCFRFDFYFYDVPRYTEYVMKHTLRWNKHFFVQGATENYPHEGDFNMSQGPWPSYTWLRPIPERYGPWRHESFPQEEWYFQEHCVYGAECMPISLAPSPRYLHSAVLYTTWNFETHARTRLCNELSTCGQDCLTNLSCLGGTSYYDDNFYFSGIYFDGDDNGITPFLNQAHVDCPGGCCRDRRSCIRTHDVMGYEVPFDSVMMLVFGGRTHSYHKVEADGTERMLYHNCERYQLQNELEREELSCREYITNELWRYHIAEAKWEYIKPDVQVSYSTGLKIDFPYPRYGHAAVIYTEVAERDPTALKVFMYVYGGLGPMCPQNAICNDVWRYEIAFAAQAYYPSYPNVDWDRANIWYRMKDCPYGGRYRHQMVITSGQDYIYVYGGQGIGGFYDQLLRYRLSTDLWEDLRPTGRISLTRLMYDNTQVARIRNVHLKHFDPDVDKDCSVAWRFDGAYEHCIPCPTCGLVTGARGEPGVQVPTDRGDFVMAAFHDPDPRAVDDLMIIFGGFRTRWGLLINKTEECVTTTTSSTTMPTIRTTTTEALPEGFSGQIVPPPPPPPEYGQFEGLSSTTPPPPTSSPTRDPAALPPGMTTASTSTTPSFITDSTMTTTTTPYEEQIGWLWDYENQEWVWTILNPTTTTTPAVFVPGTVTPLEGTERQTLPVIHGGEHRTTTSTTQPPPGTQASDGYGDGSSVLEEGPCPGEKPEFYHGDTWIFDTSMNQWAAVTIESRETPRARRGHGFIVQDAGNEDARILMYGGHNQDESFNDMWVLDIGKRIWTKIDIFAEGGLFPPSMSHHTMLYTPQLEKTLIFGGIRWDKTDLAVTDVLRDKDRRCFKEAQGLMEKYENMVEWAFLERMVAECETNGFCCILTAHTVPPAIITTVEAGEVQIRLDSGELNLTAISQLCRADCEAREFYTEYNATLIEGLWIFDELNCPRACSGHGRCEMSLCICEPDWYGLDCGSRRCPGTVCYSDMRSKEQFCLECSQNGRCIDGQCQCFPGFGFDDCSAVTCENNCSSTPFDEHGVCIEDFPVNQCHCFGRWSGRNCSELLCLNGCSDQGDCINGECHCHNGFYGTDCSLLAFPLLDSNQYANPR